MEAKNNMSIKEDMKIQIDDLEQVAGGTQTETKQLLNELRSSAFAAKFGSEWSYWGSGDLKWLADMGIEAKTSTGFLGTGIGSVNNTYRDKATGVWITHDEVIDYIRTGKKGWEN
jgi:hypothetical protein